MLAKYWVAIVLTIAYALGAFLADFFILTPVKAMTGENIMDWGWSVTGPAAGIWIGVAAVLWIKGRVSAGRAGDGQQ
jgi:hypothetical protein